MTRSSYQKAMWVLRVVLLGITVKGLAQADGPVSTCTGGGNCTEPPIPVAVIGGGAIGPGQLGMVATGRAVFAMPENATVVKGQPYQAKATTEMKQTLADGSHITQTTTATVARDSEGRTVRIQQLSTTGPWKSVSNSSRTDAPTLTTIFDPVAKTHTDYTSDNNVAHVLAMPTFPPSEAAAAPREGTAMFTSVQGAGSVGPVAFSVQGDAKSPLTADAASAKTEPLGTETIAGIPVTGTRETKTIPAGTIGNDKDHVTMRETWFSPDLQLVIRSTQTDPSFGETIYSLTNIQRSEPDATLFQVPAGYKVEKVLAAR